MDASARPAASDEYASGARPPPDRGSARPSAANSARWTAPPNAARGILRIGLRYVRGLRKSAGEAIEREQARSPFSSVEDLQRRCALRAEELTTLAQVGALATFGLTRRAALWQVAQAARPVGPLLQEDARRRRGAPRRRSPLPEMTPFEETLHDYAGASLTTGAHPMTYVRAALRPPAG